jgi:hypothetical protein
VEVTSSVHEVAKFVSVLDAVVWMAEATKQVFTMKQRHPQEALFFTKDLNNEETNGCSMLELLKSLNEATFESIGSKKYLNIDNELETGAAVKEIDELIENHQ